MRVRLKTSGGFAGLEQIYQTDEASDAIKDTIQKLESSLPPASSAPASFADGMAYEIDIEDEEGSRHYTLTDGISEGAAFVFDLLDSLRELLS